MCVLFISWQGEMTSNSRSIVRGISTQPWNKEGVQLHLNLNRYGYISRSVTTAAHFASEIAHKDTGESFFSPAKSQHVSLHLLQKRHQ